MWSLSELLNRSRVIHFGSLTACCLLLGACGFHPVYGDATVADGLTPMRGNIAIDPMVAGGREGQIFRTALEDKLNPESLKTTNAPYHLAITLRQDRIPTVVKSDGTIGRYDIRYTSQYQLFKKGTPSPVTTGILTRTGSYNVAVNANFATYEAQQNVIERTLDELAEDYVLKISGYIAAHPLSETPVPAVAPPAAAPPAAIGARP